MQSACNVVRNFICWLQGDEKCLLLIFQTKRVSNFIPGIYVDFVFCNFLMFIFHCLVCFTIVLFMKLKDGLETNAIAMEVLYVGSPAFFEYFFVYDMEYISN
jgi:hypothetical protein